MCNIQGENHRYCVHHPYHRLSQLHHRIATSRLHHTGHNASALALHRASVASFAHTRAGSCEPVERGARSGPTDWPSPARNSMMLTFIVKSIGPISVYTFPACQHTSDVPGTVVVLSELYSRLCVFVEDPAICRPPLLLLIELIVDPTICSPAFELLRVRCVLLCGLLLRPLCVRRR